jgi:nitrous oxidase accessory protein
MFSDRIHIEGNSLKENSIGLYIMYSREPTVVGNSMSNNHGPSGGGIGLKDVDHAVIEANRFINNNIAAQVDTSPREIGVENYWYGNVFAYNQLGIGFMPSVQHNTLVDNSFIDNTEHVGILGRGQLRNITWTVDGRGNYWSDYAGYDADGDGVGDRPYRSQKLFESLMNDTPELRLFLFSPSATAIDFAAKAFPEVRPETKLEDPAPLMSAPVSPLLPPLEAASTGSRAALGIAGLVAIAVPALVVAQLRARPVRKVRRARLVPEVRGS